MDSVPGRSSRFPAPPRTWRAAPSPRAPSPGWPRARAGKYRRRSPTAISMISLRESAGQVARRAHHQLQVPAAILVEHPLHGAVEQRGMRQGGDLAVEPQVHAGDGRMLKSGAGSPRLPQFRKAARRCSDRRSALAGHHEAAGHRCAPPASASACARWAGAATHRPCTVAPAGPLGMPIS
jgi:hypothetical protein